MVFTIFYALFLEKNLTEVGEVWGQMKVFTMSAPSRTDQAATSKSNGRS